RPGDARRNPRLRAGVGRFPARPAAAGRVLPLVVLARRHHQPRAAVDLPGAAAAHAREPRPAAAGMDLGADERDHAAAREAGEADAVRARRGCAARHAAAAAPGADAAARLRRADLELLT